ncbi:MAG: glycosyltransferase [Bacteroidales bacterium]|nr:glycosyltransferase [Bacteroidales bacterium]
MKIIYLIAGTYRPAGMERVLADKAGWLCANGYDVMIATTDQRGRPDAFAMDSRIRTVDLGIGYEDNNGASFACKLLKYPFKQLRHRIRLTKLLKRERADIVVSMFCNDAAFLPRINDGSRKVLEVHFSRYKRLQYGRSGLWALADKLRFLADLRTVSRYSRFVVLTEEDRSYWGQLPNISVIPNACGIRPGQAFPERSRTVLAAGRLDAQKAFDRLILAWSKLPAELGDWRLRIVGEGPERGNLQALIEKLGLSGSVSLSGAVSDMAEEYSKAALLALSSRYEGLPMVLVEAQTAGLPIVAMACKCGPRDVVSDGVDGFLVPDGDVEAMSARLAELMRNPELRLRMGENARRASARYDSSSVMARWDSLFRELAGPKRKTMVVSAVNLRKGGTLTILRGCLEHLSREAAQRDELKVVALVHDRKLCGYPGIDYIEMPWCTRSWLHRLWAEYVTMYHISRSIARQEGCKVWMWLSLHDTTPRVVAENQEVYCHTSFPFLKIRLRDWVMDPKIPIFALMGRIYFRINVKSNRSIIVQQKWYAQEMSRMLHLPLSFFRVIPPKVHFSVAKPGQPASDGVRTFFYASTPDCHKNFETLCEAARLLEREGGRFRLILTIKGDENRYARWLYGRWGNVKSIDFRGFMGKAELYATYAGSDCFVFPSRVETWGLPISEYMQVHPGGNLLLADLPYAHETSGGKAVFFPVCDPVALKNKMSALL